MLYSHNSELAIRAALFLALQPPGKLSTVHEIATGTGLPKSYLAKIIQKLAAAGLLRSFRGPGGGIELGRAPDAISLGSVVRAMEGRSELEWCLLGDRLCSREDPCPLHDRWVPLRMQIQSLLDETTVANLAQQWPEKQSRNRELLAGGGRRPGKADQRRGKKGSDIALAAAGSEKPRRIR